MKVSNILKDYSKYIPYPYSENGYFKRSTEKKQIGIHHTVSGDNTIGLDIIKWWLTRLKNTGKRVATPFVVDRNGNIYQLFSTDYWAGHINPNGITGNWNKFGSKTLKPLNIDMMCIGIELNSWGSLVESKGKYYPWKWDEKSKKIIPLTSLKPIDNVIIYDKSNGWPNGFHGFNAFEKYTDEQIESTRKILLAINEVHGISLSYNEDMWGNYNTSTKMWEPNKDAMNGKEGIWAHVSYRPDKSDCHPDPDLIEMLKSPY